MKLLEIKEMLKQNSSKEKAEILQRFFKTGKGEYGEGDIFIGVTVPAIRKIANVNYDIDYKDLDKLLKSKIHEERLTALLILVKKYQKANNEQKDEIFHYYISNLKYVDNWDLVDLTCEKIIGNYLLDKDKTLLFELAKSKNLWERRIAIISTFEFIRRNIFIYTFKIADILIYDKEDLIHKAVGWMLREIGKKDFDAEENYLKTRYKSMPRTMLRYAIEKFPEKRRQEYLKGLV